MTMALVVPTMKIKSRCQFVVRPFHCKVFSAHTLVRKQKKEGSVRQQIIRNLILMNSRDKQKFWVYKINLKNNQTVCGEILF